MIWALPAARALHYKSSPLIGRGSGLSISIANAVFWFLLIPLHHKATGHLVVNALVAERP